MADTNESREGEVAQVSVKVDVDCSDALTGLKAVQREARKAVKEVRELESYYETDGRRLFTKWTQAAADGMIKLGDIATQDLTDVPTNVLVRELAKREGVEEYEVRAHKDFASIEIDRGNGFGAHVPFSGPARILVVTD